MVGAPNLTRRERDVLSRVVDGLENKRIAHELGISEQGIKEHVSALLSKFHVANRTGLVEAALRLEFTGSLGIDLNWARQFFREAEIQICVLRGPELRYVTANEAFHRAVGHRPVIGLRMREAFPELAGQGILERVERVYATGVPSIESEAMRRWDRGAGIEERRVTLVLQPLHDADGAVDGVISFAIDVTAAAAWRR